MCDHCCGMTIQGVYCHEHGCPNADLDLCEDCSEPVEMRGENRCEECHEKYLNK